MAVVTLKGTPFKTAGELPAKGSAAPDVSLTGKDLADVSLKSFQGKKAVLNIFPSVDTSVCATSVRRFNKEAASLPGAVVLCVSADLPFAQARFCGAEGLSNVTTLSDFRNGDFGRKFGLRLTEGPLAGLLARAVVVLDEKGKVIHSQLVPEIAQEPDYQAALDALK